MVSIAQTRGEKTPISALLVRVVYASDPKRSSEYASNKPPVFASEQLSIPETFAYKQEN
jgi:hypothetical protein